LPKDKDRTYGFSGGFVDAGVAYENLVGHILKLPSER